MKQNKFLSMLAVGLLALGFTACSEDNELPSGGDDKGQQAQAYFQLSIATGNNSVTTRDAEDSGITDAGTEDENIVKTATAYFFEKIANSTTPGDYKFSCEFSSFNAKDNVYTSPVKKVENIGDFYVCVLVNNKATLTNNSITYTELADYTYTVTNGYLIDIPTDGMPMSARLVNSDGTGTIYTTISINKNNTENNPALIEMNVERSLAKVEVLASTVTSNEGGVEETKVATLLPVYKDGVSGTETGAVKIADVTIKRFKLNNLPTSYYAFRHVANYANNAWGTKSFGKINSTNPYVYEPTTETKFATSNKASLSASEYVDMPTSLSSGKSIYCLENTMLATQQKKGYVTSVVFETQVDPVKYWDIKTTDTQTKEVEEKTVSDTQSAPNTVYYYNDEFYASIDALNLHCNMNVSDDATTVLTDYGIYKYTGDDSAPRKCYYSYFIQHAPSTEDEMGVMEYAIVRNNYYKLKINAVKLPGDPTEENFDDEDDVELDEAYIQVALSVNPWIVREQGNVVLGPQ